MKLVGVSNKTTSSSFYRVFVCFLAVTFLEIFVFFLYTKEAANARLT